MSIPPVNRVAQRLSRRQALGGSLAGLVTAPILGSYALETSASASAASPSMVFAR